MDKKELKAHLIEIQTEVIDDLKAEISSYHQGADLDEEDTLDPEDYSHQTEAGNIERNLKQLLLEAESELRALEVLNDSPKKFIGPGSLLHLKGKKEMYLYVSIAALPFEHDGEHILTMSLHAPIYPLLEKKKVGEKIKLGRNSFELLDIS